MNLLKLNLFLIIIFCYYESEAQTDFRPGYVITNSNDTLHGFIDYRGEVRNSKKCTFKQNQDSEVKAYSPGEIKGYRFNESKFYMSKKVIYQDQETTLFLEFLVNGIADLYFLRDDDSTGHFFIEKSNGQIFELTNAEELIKENGKTYTHEKKEYVGLLKIAFSDCPQIYPLINQTILDTKPLIKLTKKYHNFVCDNEKCIVYEKQMNRFKPKIAAFASMNAAFLNLANAGYEYENISFQTAAYPSIGIHMKTNLPGASEKMNFLLSAEVGKVTFNGSGTYSGNTYLEKVNIQPIAVKEKALFKYTFPNGKIRPTVGVGGHLTQFLNSDSKRVQEVTSLDQRYTQRYTDNVLAVLNYGYNLELGLDYHISSSLLSFINIGYSSSTGPNLTYEARLYKSNWEIPLGNLIKTVSITTGIYF